MWSVFVISFVIFDAVPPSKRADLLFYLSTIIAAPIGGYLGFRVAILRSGNSLFTLSIETLVLALIATSTFTRSALFLTLLGISYFATLAVLAVAPRIHFSTQES